MECHVSFTDIDECARDNGNCQQSCHNSVGSYRCTCASGYSLAPDSRSCAGREPQTTGDLDLTIILICRLLIVKILKTREFLPWVSAPLNIVPFSEHFNRSDSLEVKYIKKWCQSPP